MTITRARWTTEDDRHLISGVAAGRSRARLASELGRTERAIEKRVFNLKAEGTIPSDQILRRRSRPGSCQEVKAQLPADYVIHRIEFVARAGDERSERAIEVAVRHLGRAGLVTVLPNG